MPATLGFKLNLLAPRGSAKSTLITLAYVLREALLGRQKYIWIVSDTKHQALAHLRNIHDELRDNPRLMKTYRRARAFIATGNRIRLEGVVIEAYGAGQRLRGRRFRQHRPTLIVCDDLQNDNHIRSAKQRDISRTWFHGMLMKAGTKRTDFVNLGTALHREAIAMELHTAPGWTSRRYQAIREWPTNMHLWSEWEEIYRDQDAIMEDSTGKRTEDDRPHRPRVGGAQDGELTADRALRPAPADLASVERKMEDWPDKPLDLPLHRHEAGGGEDVDPCRTSQPSFAPPAQGRWGPGQAGGDNASPPDLPTDSPPTLTRSPLHPFTRSSSAARQFFHHRQDAMQLGAKLLWPEEEDLYTLMCMRAESGPAAFEREKQCVPMNAEECEWPEAYFTGDIWFSDWPQDLRIRALALDPSKGTDAKRGDYSAFVMLGVAKDNTLYVEANLARRPTPQIVTDGIELVRQFRPQLFGIETNQFQSLLGGEFMAALRNAGLIGTAPCSIENHLAKIVRIRRLGPLLAHRRLKFKTSSPGTKMLLDQLQEFPLAPHDDAPDALEMALRLAESLAQPPPNDGLGNRLV